MQIILTATVERQFSARTTVAYECLQLGVVDATAHERVPVAEGDRREADRGVAQLQTEARYRKKGHSQSSHHLTLISTITSRFLIFATTDDSWMTEKNRAEAVQSSQTQALVFLANRIWPSP